MYQIVWASTYASFFSIAAIEFAKKLHNGACPTESDFDTISLAAATVANQAASRAQAQYDEHDFIALSVPSENK